MNTDSKSEMPEMFTINDREGGSREGGGGGGGEGRGAQTQVRKTHT